MRPLFLSCGSIFLGPLSVNDSFKSYAQWVNDQETTLYMSSGIFPKNAESLKKYITDYANNDNGILLGIFLKKSSKHIGNITIHQIDWVNRNAKIGILIGDKKSRGKGYATPVIRVLSQHAFDRLNLHKLYAGIVKDNEASRRAFEKAGYKVEGVMKEHFYHRNKYYDCYLMGLIK